MRRLRGVTYTPVVRGTEAVGVLRGGSGGAGVQWLSLDDRTVVGGDGPPTWVTVEFAVSNGRDLVVVGYGPGLAVVWDMGTGTWSRLLELAAGANEENVAFSSGGTVLAFPGPEGTLQIWDVSGGPKEMTPIAGLIAFNDGNWAVMGVDGRYDSNGPGDLKGLAWRMRDTPWDPVPVARFMEEYYEPGLLQRLLAGESFPPIEGVAERDRTHVGVAITAIDRTGPRRANVTVRVEGKGGSGLRELKLFRNSQVVDVEEWGGERGWFGDDGEWLVKFENIELPGGIGPMSSINLERLGAKGVVEFSAYALNGDGVKSETGRELLILTETWARRRRAFVIVVGGECVRESGLGLAIRG